MKSLLVERFLRSNICKFLETNLHWQHPGDIRSPGLAVNWCSSATSPLTPLDWRDTSVLSEECSGWQPPGYPTVHCCCQTVGLFLYHVRCQTRCHPVPHSAETLLAVKIASENFFLKVSLEEILSNGLKIASSSIDSVNKVSHADEQGKRCQGVT